MKTITALLLGATALAASTISVSASHPYPVLSSAGGPTHPFNRSTPGRVPLWNQNSNDSGMAVVSQNFTSGSLSAYDSQSADDFVVPGPKHEWIVSEVDVTGQYFSGAGPASSENVFFYSDANGLPGNPVKGAGCSGLIGKGNGTGSFQILLPRGCRARLKGVGNGTRYWVSVQINMNFSVGGEWGQEVQTTQEQDPAAWQNPGNGFGTGCTTWADQLQCTGIDMLYAGSGDNMFGLKGKVAY